jgi:hypothetical protein
MAVGVYKSQVTPFRVKSDSSLGPCPWLFEATNGVVLESEHGPWGPLHVW